jgi:hypothetical protein
MRGRKLDDTATYRAGVAASERVTIPTNGPDISGIAALCAVRGRVRVHGTVPLDLHIRDTPVWLGRRSLLCLASSAELPVPMSRT